MPVRVVTGRNPQTLEEFFLANAESFGSQGHVGAVDKNWNRMGPSITVPGETL